jgi:parallel beta-helix repeat protein
VVRAHGRRLLLPLALLLCGGGCDPGEDLLEAFELTAGHSGNADFPSIGAAVGSARAGAIVRVEPGTYIDNVIIEQAVTLIAEAGGPVLIVSEAGTLDPVIEVRGSIGVRIEGLTVRGPGDGIQVRDSSEVVIASVVASDNGEEGIDVSNSKDVAIRSCTVSGSIQDGIQVAFSTSVTVSSCTIRDNSQDGVQFEASSACTLSDSIVASNGDDGVLVGESSGVRLLRNTITGNLDNGIHLRASPDTVLEDNVLLGNLGGAVEVD